MVLAHIMVASETTGHLRDGRIINYLFKSVFELVEQNQDTSVKFSFEDISILVDAYYKT